MLLFIIDFFNVNFFLLIIIICLIQCLGCKSLSESIEEKIEVLGNSQETNNSRDLQKKINEIAHLFYYDYPKHVIRKNEGWLKRLKVKEIDKIEIKYLLK